MKALYINKRYPHKKAFGSNVYHVETFKAMNIRWKKKKNKKKLIGKLVFWWLDYAPSTICRYRWCICIAIYDRKGVDKKSIPDKDFSNLVMANIIKQDKNKQKCITFSFSIRIDGYHSYFFPNCIVDTVRCYCCLWALLTLTMTVWTRANKDTQKK